MRLGEKKRGSTGAFSSLRHLIAVNNLKKAVSFARANGFAALRLKLKEKMAVEMHFAEMSQDEMIDFLSESRRTDSANIEITSDCNLRCVYCASGQPGYVRADMDLKYLDDIVNELILRNVTGVSYCGHGETTSIKGWHSYCNKFIDAGISLHITSNFSRVLTDEEALTLAHFEVIDISCDTVDQELFKKIRRGGDFRNILYNMGKIRMLALKHGLPGPKFEWSCVVTDKIVYGLEEYVTFGLAQGVKLFNFCNLAFYPNTEFVKPITQMSKEEITRLPNLLQRVLDTIKEKGGDYIFPAGVLTSLEDKVDEIEDRPIQDRKAMTRDCLDPWNYIFIRSDLSVQLCCAGSEKVGSLGDGRSLGKILNNEVAKQYRRGLLTGKLKPSCVNCTIKGWIETEAFVQKVTQFCSRDLKQTAH